MHASKLLASFISCFTLLMQWNNKESFLYLQCNKLYKMFWVFDIISSMLPKLILISWESRGRVTL